ncbi:MAG: XRE family transcriptional regulator [Defluviitaleaceae bacterium]|nr:XRE family transcriptional regulator [Defluviitaleaceae bacterium]MCL2274772.1 XRE family transcriptional regulator [Defluviitaleaceae bacterium]
MNRIKSLRESHKMQQRNLAGELQVSQATLSNWERGKHEPDKKSLMQLSEIFNVSIDFILGNTSVENLPGRIKQKCFCIPIMGHIPSEAPIETVMDCFGYEEIPIDWIVGGKEFFALQIKDNSMAPKYIDGDVVIFLAAKDCDSGDECAVIVNGESAVFKKVIKKESGMFLHSLNTDEYEPSFFCNGAIKNRGVRIIGIAEEVRRRIRKE